MQTHCFARSKTLPPVAVVVDEDACGEAANGNRESEHVGNGEIRAKEPAV